MWRRLRRWAYPQAAAVVALTAGTAQWLGRHVPGSRLTVIPNAVRWPLESTEPAIEPSPRQGRYRVLAVGRLHPHKGFDLLIRAFEEIAGHFTDGALVSLGEGGGRVALQGKTDAAGLSVGEKD